MENSGQKVKRHKILRLETLRRAKTSKCIGGCKGNLLKLANNNLNRNNSTFFRCNHCSTCRNNKLGQNLSSKKFMSKFRNTFESINKRVCTSRRWKNRYSFFEWLWLMWGIYHLAGSFENSGRDALDIAVPKTHFSEYLIMNKKHTYISNINLPNAILYEQKN